MKLRQKQQQLEQVFLRLKQELAPVEADEERRVQQAIAPEVERHQEILARSRELASRKVLRGVHPNGTL